MSVAAQQVRRFVMRRFPVVLSVVVVMLLGIAALRAYPHALAQEATPAAEEYMPEGLTFEPIGFAPGVMVPSPADLLAARVSFEPGTGFPLEPSDPEGAFVVLESGALTVRVDEMAWTITRGAALGAMMATPEAAGDLSGAMEEVAMGEEATLEAGDSAYIPGGVNGEVRNDGPERADAIVFLVSPPEGMSAATPTP
jgi:quercetin dioxygenase-like cupin family protein